VINYNVYDRSDDDLNFHSIDIKESKSLTTWFNEK